MSEPGMVERVAAAMHDRFHEEAAEVMKLRVPPRQWADADAPCRRFYLASARAGLEMMRDPPDSLCVPGGLAIEEALFESQDKLVFDGARDCFNAMIDAALGEKND